MDKTKTNLDLVVENKQCRQFSDIGFISYDKFKRIKVFKTISLYWIEKTEFRYRPDDL